jgi:predicted O-linked N-acetylglucosamine transferase (SPINDLY family)
MTTAPLSSMDLLPLARDVSVSDLIRTTEVLKQGGQSNAAELLYATWIQHNQDHPLLYAVLFNYSVILADGGKLVPARECLERAIVANGDFMPAYINLGRVLERSGNVGAALVQWAAALAKMEAVSGAAVTHKITALNQSARALEAAGHDEAAEKLLRTSLEVDPHQREAIQHLVALRQRQCEWPVMLPSDRVERTALMEGMSPLSAAALTDDPMLQLALAHSYNERDVGTPAGAVASWPRRAGGSARLKIGYLSSDLREHAVGYLMTEVLGLHDRDAVEVFAYYCGPASNDPLHASFRAGADHWVSITGMDDAAAAKKMADDGIQILIDLNGYTREARLKLVALRPAPVIVNWLGFPGTMASPYHHYIIADDWIIPETHEAYYSEQVLRLPCYQPSSRTRTVSPTPPSRKAVGLPEDAVVYCCFNGTHKITPFTLDRWLAILARVPGSVLWLLAGTPSTNERLRDHAASRGIARERLVFAEKMPNASHLARYALADLFLDTTPYGAHTTASDALWMGVPVLTLSGRSFASRVCGSLVRAAGLPELVHTKAEDFIEHAVQLGTDAVARQRLREHFAKVREGCTLFDMPLLVRRLEELYRHMWGQFEKGSLPRPDLTNLDAYLEVGVQVKHEEVEVQSIDDYRGWWREQLARRHAFRPLARDHRLFGAEAGDAARELDGEHHDPHT